MFLDFYFIFVLTFLKLLFQQVSFSSDIFKIKVLIFIIYYPFCPGLGALLLKVRVVLCLNLGGAFLSAGVGTAASAIFHRLNLKIKEKLVNLDIFNPLLQHPLIPIPQGLDDITPPGKGTLRQHIKTLVHKNTLVYFKNLWLLGLVLVQKQTVTWPLLTVQLIHLLFVN